MRGPNGRAQPLVALSMLAGQPLVRWWALAVVLNRLLPAMGVLGYILAGQQARGSLADGALLAAAGAMGFAVGRPGGAAGWTASSCGEGCSGTARWRRPASWRWRWRSWCTRPWRCWSSWPLLAESPRPASRAGVGLFESALPARVEELGLPAAAAGGYVTAAYLGSRVGGLVVTVATSATSHDQRRTAWRALALLVWSGGGLMAAAAAGTPVTLAIASIAAGLTLAPLYALGAIVLQARLPAGRHAEGVAASMVNGAGASP